MSTLRIAIIGGGNVATHLADAMARHAIVTTVEPRTLANLPHDYDLYLICVTDNVIGSVATQLTEVDGVVAHTSGTTPLSVLVDAGCRRCGVLYPMQTFTKGVVMEYDSIPIFIETSAPTDIEVLREAARCISPHIKVADSGQRRILHLASVLCCNFTNHLWALAETLLNDHGLDFKPMLPLIRRTADKVTTLSPIAGQTGPARRGDTKTIEAHLRMLPQDSRLHEIYELLTSSIYETYHKP